MWIDEGVPGIAVNAILEYYAYECPARYRKEQAKVLCRAFRNYGFDTWFQQQLGWQPKAKPEKPMTLAEQCLMNAQALVDQEREIDRLKVGQHGHQFVRSALAEKLEVKSV